jgi:hypothetical protein
MLANPSPAAAAPANALKAPALTGNWLAVYGNIVTGASAATFAPLAGQVRVQAHVPAFQAAASSALITRVRHLTAIASVPPLVAGPYSIQLLGASNNQLANYAFTPQPATSDHPNWLAFTQVVNYVAGTTQLRILAGSQVLATQNIPASGPTISSVHLVGAPNPVTGTVTLQWTAGDSLGNPLTFDIFYSRDGGASLQPLMVNVSGSSAPVDTSRLGGSGTALLRVVATDGVNTAQADSAPFTMANKPPEPMILNPADGTRRHYGQLVNFSGTAIDAQDGSVSSGDLEWSDQNGALGTGALLSVADLPVGTDVITLKATDGDGLSASTSITVYVDDSLSLPTPSLSVGPQQFAWSFASNAAAAQTDTLEIDNGGGGGVVTPTVTTDAAWLHLSAASGPTPLPITLTVSPAGLANNSALSGHIYVNLPATGGSPAQQVVVPVNIAVGVDFAHPPLGVASRLFLPAVRR